MCSASEREFIVETVLLSPTQSNEIILEKLELLLPKLEHLLADMRQLREELYNGIIRWQTILESMHKL